MITQVTIEIYKKIWPFALMAVFINWFLFGLNANNSTFLPLDRAVIDSVMLPFALETFLYAIWLQWSPQQMNLWRQLATSETNIQTMLLPSFLGLSLLVQLFPLLAFMHYSQTSNEMLMAIDYFSFIGAWFWSLLAYGLGVMLCWWRHWTFSLIIPSIFTFLNFSGGALHLQLFASTVFFVLFLIFIKGNKNVKSFTLALFISFGCYLFIAISVTALNNNQLSGVAIRDKMQQSSFETLYKNKEVDLAYHYRPVKLFTSQAYIHTTKGYRADWHNYKLILGPYKKPANKEVWLRNKEIIEQNWQENHPKQTPVIGEGKRFSKLFFFKDAIYQNHSNVDKVTLWKANNKQEQINWIYSGDQQSDFSLILFGNDKSFNWILWTPEGERLHRVLPITSQPEFINLAGYAENGIIIYKLLIQTNNGQQTVYNLDNLFAEPELASDINIGVSRKLKTQVDELSSWTHYLMRNFMWTSTKPMTPLWLILVSHLLSTIIALIYFRKDNFKMKLVKACFCFVFAWPSLLSLIICFPKQKQVNWQLPTNSIVQ